MAEIVQVGFAANTAPLDKLDDKLVHLQGTAKQTGTALKTMGAESKSVASEIDASHQKMAKATGQYIDAMGRLRDVNGRFIKQGQESVKQSQDTRKEHEQHTKSVGILAASYNALRATASSVGNALSSSLVPPLKVLGGAVKTAGQFTAGFAGGLVGGVASLATVGGIIAFTEAIRNMADRAGQLKDFSDTTEITVRGLQALEKIASESGVSAQNLGIYMERLTAQFDDVGKRTGPLYDGLREVNRGLAEEISSTKDAEQRLTLLARAIKMADTEQRAIIGKAAAGRGFGGFVRLMLGLDDAGGMTKAMSDFNRVDEITKQQADRWDTLGDQIAENAKRIKQNIMAPFMEPVLSGLKGFTDSLLELSRAFREFSVSPDGKMWMDWAIRLAQLNPISGANAVVDAVRKYAPEGYGGGKPVVKPPGADGSWGMPKDDPTSGVSAPSTMSQQTATAKAQAEELQKLFDAREKLIDQAGRDYRMRDAHGDSEAEDLAHVDKLLKQIDEYDVKIQHAKENTGEFGKAVKSTTTVSWEGQANDLQKTVSRLGDAATIAEQYRLKVIQLRAAVDKGEIGEKEYARATAELNVQRFEQMAAQRTQIGVASEMELRTAALARVERQRAMGLVSETEYERARAIAVKESRDAFEAMQVKASQLPGVMRYGYDALNGWKQFDQVLVSSFGNFENAVAGVVSGTQSISQAIKSMTQSIISDLTKLVVRQGITGPLAQMLGLGAMGGGAGGGLFSWFKPAAAGGGGAAASTAGLNTSISTFVAHGGGVVGNDALATRVVDLAAFRNAKRYHRGGIASNEVPTILEREEEVLRRNDPRHRYNLGRAANGNTPAVTVVLPEPKIVNAHPTGRVRTDSEDDGKGGRRPIYIFEEVTAQAMTRTGAPAANALERMGVRQPMVRR